MRRDAERFVLELMGKLDPSGLNERRYRKAFEAMSDAQFEKWVSDIESGTRRLEVIAPNMHVNIYPEQVYAAADHVGVNTHQRVRIWDENDERYVTSREEYLLAILPVRVARQYVLHKLSVVNGDTKTDVMTGQVVGDNKASSWSFVQQQALNSRDLSNVANEFVGIRGGNMESYQSMKAQLEDAGTATIAHLSTRTRAADTASAMLVAMCIGNNL